MTFLSKFLHWLKWQIAPKEMAELERWHIYWHEHRRWFAEFPAASLSLDHLKANVDREPVVGIVYVRDSLREYQKKVGNHGTS